MKHLTYTPTGVCAKQLDIDTEDGIIKKVEITGGCHGNSQGVASLLKGMPLEDAIQRMEGICCKGKPTSCPDQLAQALKTMR